ncbi:MAG: RsmD family RNA methyltransferase, partial [Acidimicrobiales bacterium]
MRVVAGELGGRRLVAPTGADTRPTPERVREATFNALESLDAIDGAVVVDLFAGSGAMGIEALSRGAARVTFVERDR